MPSLKWTAISKKVPFFRRTYALSVSFKMKPLKKRFTIKTKTNPNFAVKLAERGNHSFLLYI